MKVLELREFQDFETKVVKTASVLMPEWGGNFTSDKLVPIRKQLAQKLYQTDEVYLKGKEPKEEATGPVPATEPDLPDMTIPKKGRKKK